MDNGIFKKMKAKQGFTACVLYAPDDYPVDAADLVFSDAGQVDFVHLFVGSRADFESRIAEALRRRKPGGLLWISYPKGSGKVKYDINRDSMWDLSIPKGIHPVAQVALDETWSALRFVDNLPGETYERPGK